MELKKAWELADFYLGHIVNNTKELQRNISAAYTVAETPASLACILREVEEAEKEAAEALRLSQSARHRLQNLYSHQRKGIQDGCVE